MPSRNHLVRICEIVQDLLRKFMRHFEIPCKKWAIAILHEMVFFANIASLARSFLERSSTILQILTRWFLLGMQV